MLVLMHVPGAVFMKRKGCSLNYLGESRMDVHRIHKGEYASVTAAHAVNDLLYEYGGVRA